MPKRIENRLTAAAANRLSKPGFHADGGGLYLRIEGGRRLWVFRYRLSGKQRWHSLGPARDIPLAEAREKARQCRLMLRDGISPADARKDELEARRAEQGRTFEATAMLYIESHKPRWSEKHAADWLYSLRMYAFARLASKPVAAITVSDVLEVLEPLWTTKTETASRIRGRIEAVIGYATARHWRAGPNPAAWAGNLKHLLPPRSEIARVEHFSALPWRSVPAMMAAAAKSSGFSALCLRFTVLTASRPAEARGARWSEIDMQEAIWTVPAERTKGDREHRVPLSTEALAILRELKPLRVSPDDLVFPGGRAGRPLTDVAVSKALRAAAGEGFTVHGTARSSFRDWAADQTAFPREIAEAALAHVNADKVEAAYLRSDLFDRRRRLMQAWAEFVAGPVLAAGDVVQIGKARA